MNLRNNSWKPNKDENYKNQNVLQTTQAKSILIKVLMDK